MVFNYTCVDVCRAYESRPNIIFRRLWKISNASITLRRRRRWENYANTKPKKKSAYCTCRSRNKNQNRIRFIIVGIVRLVSLFEYGPGERRPLRFSLSVEIELHVFLCDYSRCGFSDYTEKIQMTHVAGCARVRVKINVPRGNCPSVNERMGKLHRNCRLERKWSIFKNNFPLSLPVIWRKVF